jgi:CDGSH-type Zn-finger protein/uncharacterized Fe-S cluster protein YjdI
MARRKYENEQIRVHWDSSRCIHTARCLNALPEVFDARRRPWVDIDAAEAEAVARTVELCPTGALLYERLDGAPQEEAPAPTRVMPIDDGPLIVRGNLRVETPDGDVIAEETRLALCRCGATRNQPFCDNSHLSTGFESGPSQGFASFGEDDPDSGDVTTIVATEDGPLHVRGPVRVETPDGELLGSRPDLWLCRCGQSGRKPLCDSSHLDAGFCSSAPAPGAERQDAESPAAFEPNPGIDC